MADQMSKGTPTAERIAQLVVFLLTLAILPILLPIMFIFRIYRNILKVLIRRAMGDDKVMMVSGSDSVWMQDTPQNRAVISCFMYMDGKMDIEKYRQVILERLAMVPDPKNLKKKLMPKITSYATKILHRYVWIPEPHFDINEHVRVHPGPCPMDKEGIERLVGELCSTPLPNNKAAWEFVMLNPGKDHPDYGKRHYAVFRVHHSIADGISLVRMFLKRLVDKEPEVAIASGKRFGTKDFMRKALQAVFEGPAMLLSRLVHPADSNIIHGPKLSGTKLFSWSDPIDLELVKKIKNATNTTVNDVIMSCLASSFREYFKRRACTIPDNIRSYIPVDIRSSKADVTLDNQFALVFLDLPLDEDDPLETLRKTKTRMDRVKASPEPIVNALVIEYAMNRLPNWLTEWFFSWAAGKSSLILSNVPGPSKQFSVAGNAVDTLLFWPPQKTNVGVCASIFSYCGNIRIAVGTDKNIMANPRVLVEEFVTQLKSLASALKLE